MGDSDEVELGETASHADRLSLVIGDARTRRDAIADALRSAFAGYIEIRQTEWIVFSRLSVEALSTILRTNPSVFKSVTAACNIAGRAIRRDLGFEVNTYDPKLTQRQADQLAGYIRPFLPEALALPTLEAIDDFWFLDKELRKTRGQWEKLIEAELTRRTGHQFRKRRFLFEGMDFELDAAHPPRGEPIEVGVDVKGISHPRDFHKRGDEIVNKAEKFKIAFPNGKFGAVLHYPFLDSRDNVIQRLGHTAIDGIVFAGDNKESIENAILTLLPQLGLPVVDETPPRTSFEEITDD